jgi:hypothetical protein
MNDDTPGRELGIAQRLHGVRDGMNPGDEAPPGTPDTGENVCPTCGGSGRREGGECPTCGGTGKVIEAIGGAG